jgi:hypothetical protein
MATNVATRKTNLVSEYIDELGNLLRAMNRLQALKITYDSLPAFVDADFTTPLQSGGAAPFPWLDAATFSTGVGNADNLIKRVTDGTSTVAVGTRNTLEAIVPVVPR